ncbi:MULTISPECIES: hypothetical protein [Streptomyces]|uniref:Uncharacterized protein n=1 Tax=Streptomyces paromomycinus TaxID=92743 RepID=A0A401VXJ4_STREY|nr:hypothetical protein [Streptomyces paromomycinus]GCD41803.1 hypothetical protein GKJPGBOP_01460 [Streptomyces paromomycinus]
MNDFIAPLPKHRISRVNALFTTKVVRRVQAPWECHEYKKVAGSSDAARTYDTTAV